MYVVAPAGKAIRAAEYLRAIRANDPVKLKRKSKDVDKATASRSLPGWEISISALPSITAPVILAISAMRIPIDFQHKNKN